MPSVRARVVVTGRVQGVWFRGTTRGAAVDLGLTGWVANRPDGSVEALFEGEESAVRRMVEWCRHGPPLARVEGVQVAWETYTGEFADFAIAW